MKIRFSGFTAAQDYLLTYTFDVTVHVTENPKTLFLLSTYGVMQVQYTPKYRTENTSSI